MHKLSNSSNSTSNKISNTTFQNKARKTPNRFLAPVVIAGVTIGFLASAYKFVFTKPDPVKSLQEKQHIDQNKTENNLD